MKKMLSLFCAAALALAVMTAPALAAGMSTREAEACALVNAERTARGLAPLAVSSSLSDKARIKAQDMADNDYFSHTSPTYGSPFTMMRTLGVSYRSAAENIAMGYNKADTVVAAWMASPSHRANLLASRYVTVGIGYADGYWAQWLIK